MQEWIGPARQRAGFLFGGLLLAAGVFSEVQADDGLFHLAVYGGRAAEERMLDILTRFDTGFRDAYLVAVAPGMVVRDHGRWRQELEGQVIKHFGDQDHWEFNAAWVARWMRFPWDHRLDTRAALGLGLSWASEIPPIEPRAKEEEGESARFLGYVAIELEFAPPGGSAWSGFARLHHRSDAFGLFHDQRGGSNFVTLGVRRRL
jgi:hypothetical protein